MRPALSDLPFAAAECVRGRRADACGGFRALPVVKNGTPLEVGRRSLLRWLMVRRRNPALTFTAMAMAPFVSIVLGLYVLHNAWSALLFYHIQIGVWALWVPRETIALRKGWSASWLVYLGLPCLLSAPLLYVLLGEALQTDVRLGEWLDRYGLSGAWLIAFACYYGLIHPLFEQFHWDTLRRMARPPALAHAAFATYHVLVLALLLKPGWVAVSFVILLATSWVWGRVREHLGGLSVPIWSHVIADAAIIGVTCLMTMR